MARYPWHGVAEGASGAEFRRKSSGGRPSPRVSVRRFNWAHRVRFCARWIPCMTRTSRRNASFKLDHFSLLQPKSGQSLAAQPPRAAKAVQRPRRCPWAGKKPVAITQPIQTSPLSKRKAFRCAKNPFIRAEKMCARSEISTVESEAGGDMS
ncbi:hypothetical protein CISG_09705 [Coccidioides immitis RMSCC 3703]|uniref:Uncharacterized protein n=2 Tax=Coccidioides immitis TaxID=5501 RepID=A0A0J8QKD0_COCIT|nr:hypothetical protein CIRG_09800 [Coccidioides immitis RMSCC 2394]KMU72906.1 hypothetical protein CISG_09705 [Coccidioides immitis RMSCC 3703]